MQSPAIKVNSVVLLCVYTFDCSYCQRWSVGCVYLYYTAMSHINGTTNRGHHRKLSTNQPTGYQLFSIDRGCLYTKRWITNPHHNKRAIGRKEKNPGHPKSTRQHSGHVSWCVLKPRLELCEVETVCESSSVYQFYRGKLISGSLYTIYSPPLALEFLSLLL